jgi:cell division protease FtsH
MKILYVILPFCKSFILPKLYRKRSQRQLLPSQITDPITDNWDYNTLVENSKHIEGITLVRTNNELTNLVALSDHTLHQVNLIPEFTNNIIELLLKYHIPFDYKNIYPINPLQIIGGYIALSVLFNVFRRNPANMVKKPTKVEIMETKFDDVAGCDEVKLELSEVVDFLKYPQKYKESGAKLPRGVLLEGPPGTGKTLLARAVAGEANVPFFYSSGSQFIEMFVGVGAARVRELFENARKENPCVIFIDEIDAIGRQRGNGGMTGNDEREQTLNEILTNMDGFMPNEGVIVIAATNRADILDSALTRPGRFDRKIYVGLPDQKGRTEIIKVHSKNKKLDPSVNLVDISKLTRGFSGADIENLLNEASILSVRYNETRITMNTLMNAFEKITFGLPSKYDSRSDELLKMISYHEIGHTLIALLFPDLVSVEKVTIQGNKNGAGGYTLFLPNEPYDSYPTKQFMLVNIMISLGGRIAEQILYKDKPKNVWLEDVIDLEVSTGASNDLKQANQLARNYVKLFGRLHNEESSEYTKSEMDREIENIMEYCFMNAEEMLTTHKDTLNALAYNLTVYKTLNSTFLNNIKI